MRDKKRKGEGGKREEEQSSSEGEESDREEEQKGKDQERKEEEKGTDGNQTENVEPKKKSLKELLDKANLSLPKVWENYHQIWENVLCHQYINGNNWNNGY